MMGRHPLTANVEMKEGDHHSKTEHRERKKVEDALMSDDRLACPTFLSQAGKNEWQRLMKQYRKMGTKFLCSLDRQALIVYCEHVSTFRKAQREWVEKFGSAVTDDDPKRQARIDRLLKTMNVETDAICKLLDQLCLSPLSRARMGIAVVKKEKSRMDEFLESIGDGKGEGGKDA